VFEYSIRDFFEAQFVEQCARLVLFGPYVVLWLIFQMPDVLRTASVWIPIFSWGIAAGYKDWLMDARKRENNSRLPE
jgi:hypothetical protein